MPRFLRPWYKREIQNSPECIQEEWLYETLAGTTTVEALDGQLRTFSFILWHDIVEEEVSLFNTTHLKQICDIFPNDIWYGGIHQLINILQLCTCIFSANTKELVVMIWGAAPTLPWSSTTVKQYFKKLVSSIHLHHPNYQLERFLLLLKLQNKWGDRPHSVILTDLVNLFGVPGNHLHLSKADKGCIALLWLNLCY